MSDRDYSSDDQDSGADVLLPPELLEMAQEAGGDMVSELLGIFQEDSQARLQELYRAIVDEDTGMIQNQAHALKGSAAQIGAMAVSGLCRQMERLSKTGTALERKVLFEEIAAALREVLARIPIFQAMAAQSSRVS